MNAALPYIVAAVPIVLALILLALGLCKAAALADAEDAQRSREDPLRLLDEIDAIWAEERNVEIKHRPSGGWVSGGKPSEIPPPTSRGWHKL